MNPEAPDVETAYRCDCPGSPRLMQVRDSTFVYCTECEKEGFLV